MYLQLRNWTVRSTPNYSLYCWIVCMKCYAGPSRCFALKANRQTELRFPFNYKKSNISNKHGWDDSFVLTTCFINLTWTQHDLTDWPMSYPKTDLKSPIIKTLRQHGSSRLMDSCKSSFTLDLYLNFIFALRYISRLSWDLTGVRAQSIRSRLICKIDVLWDTVEVIRLGYWPDVCVHSLILTQLCAGLKWNLPADLDFILSSQFANLHPKITLKH